MYPEYIVVHTAAFNGKDCDRDMIDAWHKARNWSGIGYHFVIVNDQHSSKADGSVESGRPTNKAGAHALGLNSRSLGICCIGHGDINDFTPAQYQSLYRLIRRLMTEFAIPVEKVIGHRELNQLAERGVISSRYRTSKSCPGSKVDMDFIREQLPATAALSDANEQPSPELREAIKQAVAVLQQHRSHYPNAQDELDEFIHHPEVISLSQ
ncbi:N-acetylmuramoyl-L-alanine amidase [Colwellia chukchiensis]|uniref:N-acetylmuramoyl-L-alanine amidase n=1 Tax=Colwellia chukchiensis TaxID=641665 RepID=A0A1H7HXL7_9GAMM|nr:N-acetylmuramoyl-L-alanine amidase [Colwellia chukchiensis]SEK54342.1 N-acetylmuramoyl-L-alanine amidase [Colwellia chukchiensis]